MAERGYAAGTAGNLEKSLEAIQPRLEELNKENISTSKFDECWFVAQLVEFSHTRSGDVLVKIRIPYMYRHQPSKLQDAYGQPLQVHVSKWTQAEEARERAERGL